MLSISRERKKDGVEGCFFFLLGIFIDCAYNGEYKQRTKMYKKCGYYKQPHTYILYVLYSFLFFLRERRVYKSKRRMSSSSNDKVELL